MRKYPFQIYLSKENLLLFVFYEMIIINNIIALKFKVQNYVKLYFFSII